MEKRLRMSKLLMRLGEVNRLHGPTVVAQILLGSVSDAYCAHARRWVQLGEGEIFSFLRLAGVDVRTKGRRVHVSDKRGRFEFTDDYYWSGLRYLVNPIAKALKLDFNVDGSMRVPNSLIVYFGLEAVEDPCASAIERLVHLHSHGEYDSRPVLRLQGGEFKSLRNIVFDTARPVCFSAPAAGRAVRTKRGRNRGGVNCVELICRPNSNLLDSRDIDSWVAEATKAVTHGLTNESRELVCNMVSKKESTKVLKRAMADSNGGLEDFLRVLYVYSGEIGLNPAQRAGLVGRNCVHLKNVFLGG